MSPKKIHTWAMSTWKNIRHHSTGRPNSKTTRDTTRHSQDDSIQTACTSSAGEHLEKTESAYSAGRRGKQRGHFRREAATLSVVKCRVTIYCKSTPRNIDRRVPKTCPHEHLHMNYGNSIKHSNQKV